MKIPVSIRLDEQLFVLIKKKPNITRYIEGLIKEDLQMGQRKPIVRAVAEDLLADEHFIQELANRVSSPTPLRMGVPLSVQKEVLKDPRVGLPCCEKANPCKHWHFDDVGGNWVNELSGAVRET